MSSGLLKQIAKDFYELELTWQELSAHCSSSEESFEYRLRLNFRNGDYMAKQRALSASSLDRERVSISSSTNGKRKSLSALSSTVLLQLFPFTIVFRKDLDIFLVGRQLRDRFGDGEVLGRKLPDIARMRRPKVKLAWDSVNIYSHFF